MVINKMNKKQITNHLRKLFSDNELLHVEVGNIFISFKLGVKKPLYIPEGLHGNIIFNGFDRYMYFAIKLEDLKLEKQ